MLQLENRTPFNADIALFPDARGIDSLYIMVKASFDIGEQWSLSTQQQPLVEADEYHDEPDNSSLKAASDYHIGKPATDVIMQGEAITPNNENLTRHEVRLCVGKLDKRITVFGDRRWHKDGVIGPAQPFNRMPLIYERAFGGTLYNDQNEMVGADPRNPVGRGLSGDHPVGPADGDTDGDGVALPNLELADQLIGDPADRPSPAGFGFIAPAWQPRAGLAGTYDEAWQQQRAPFLPLDFDPRFLNTAPVDQVCPGYLNGGEPVIIEGMHARGALRFDLPHVVPKAMVELDQQNVAVDFKLETLLLQPNQLQVHVVWRAALACNKKAIKIKRVRVTQQH